MPEEAFTELYCRSGALCNLTGSPGNNMHNDESLETRGVLSTKNGDGNATPGSLKLSFFSIKHTTSVSKQLSDMVCPPSEDIKTEAKRKQDKESRSFQCVKEIVV